MKSLWRIMRYMRPYRLVIVFGVITVILPVAMELLVPRLLQNVIDDGIRQMDMDAIVSGALAMVVAALVTAVSAIVQGICRATLYRAWPSTCATTCSSIFNRCPLLRWTGCRPAG
jgi:ABC-type multidrug transport system fused ATPase/permease subunit